MKTGIFAQLGLGVALLAGLSTTAEASLTIDYSDAVSAPGKISPFGSGSLTVGDYSGSALLTPNGPAVTEEINPFTWAYKNGTTGTISAAFSSSLGITFPGGAIDRLPPSGALGVSDSASLNISKVPHSSAEHQTLTISPTTGILDYSWVSGTLTYNLYVTPLQFISPTEVSSSSATDYLGVLQASFLLTAVPEASSVTAIPEPSTWVAGTGMLIPLGMSALRILRRRQAA